MANPSHPETPNLHHLVTSQTKNDDDLASERLISLYSKDAPRDLFTPTSTSPNTPSTTGADNPKQETDSVNTAPMESTDSEKAVKGSDSESQTDGRVMLQGATVDELPGYIFSDNSDELYGRGDKVRIFGVTAFLLVLKLG